MSKSPTVFGIVCFFFCTGFSPVNIDGVWMPLHPKWQKAPYGDPASNQTEDVAEMDLLCFLGNGQFVLFTGSINRMPGKWTTISEGDPQTIYVGKWKDKLPETIKYRLVAATEAEVLPKISHIAKLLWGGKGNLIFGGEQYKRAPELDVPVQKVLKETPGARIKFP
jgi:hypothetical protein